jgi:protein TonB
MIIKDVDLNSDRWCDLVFEGKNQEYGAYNLRKTSTKRHLLALSIVIITFSVILFLFKFVHFNPTQNALEYEVKLMELSSLDGLEESYRRDPPVKIIKKPSLEEIVKFTPPMVTEDENIANDTEELQETNTDSESDSINTAFALTEEEAFLLRVEEQDTALIDEKNRDAEFPGGRVELIRYIYQNIRYPSVAIKQRIQGRVVCSFIINEDGSVSNIALIQGVYSFLDEEALRVIGIMPRWKPAMKDGKPVKTKCIVPIVFRL